MTSRLCGPALALLVGVGAALLPAVPAWAHTTLAGTSVDGGVLAPGADEVALHLRGEVRPELSSVVVLGADGEDRGTGRVRLRGDDVVRRLATPLPAGSWTLSYRVVAADGHLLTGSLPFRVAGGPVPAAGSPRPAVPAAAPVPPPVPADRSPVRVVAGSAVAGTLALGALLALRRRRVRP